MQKQGPNGIEWCTHTWNPITGCKGSCPWCYARKIAQRFAGTKAFPQGFEPHYRPERLNEPLRKSLPSGSKVFVGSMSDIFGDWIPREQIDEIISVAKNRPDVFFLWLTKNPSRLAEFNPWPENCWVGASAENNYMACAMINELDKVKATLKFLSIEPLLSWDDRIYFEGIAWVIIGAMTGHGARPPEEGAVKDCIIDAELARVPLFVKSNLRPYFDGELRQEYPKEIR